MTSILEHRFCMLLFCSRARPCSTLIAAEWHVACSVTAGFSKTPPARPHGTTRVAKMVSSEENLANPRLTDQDDLRRSIFHHIFCVSTHISVALHPCPPMPICPCAHCVLLISFESFSLFDWLGASNGHHRPSHYARVRGMKQIVEKKHGTWHVIRTHIAKSQMFHSERLIFLLQSKVSGCLHWLL